MSIPRTSLILAAAVAFAAPAFAADPFFGSFMLDAARSTSGERCAAFTLEDLGNDKFRLTGVRVAGDGTLLRQDGVFAFDGGAHADGAGGTASFTRIDEHRYAVVTKGIEQSTAMRTMTDDGATMVENADGVRDDEPFHASRVFTRGTAPCDAGK